MKLTAGSAAGRAGEARPRERVDGERPPAGPEAGFGLVEVLIAAVVLAVGLLAVAGIALGVAAQTQGAALATDQALAGQQVLEVSVVGGYAALPTGTKDTTVALGDAGYRVTRTVTQVGTRLKRVEVRMPGRGASPEESMMTYLHRPEPAPPAP